MILDPLGPPSSPSGTLTSPPPFREKTLLAKGQRTLCGVFLCLPPHFDTPPFPLSPLRFSLNLPPQLSPPGQSRTGVLASPPLLRPPLSPNPFGWNPFFTFESATWMSAPQRGALLPSRAPPPSYRLHPDIVTCPNYRKGNYYLTVAPPKTPSPPPSRAPPGLSVWISKRPTPSNGQWKNLTH